MIKNQIEKICTYCKDAYSVKASRSGKSKYCSAKCKAANLSAVMAGSAMPEGCIKEKYSEYTRLGIADKCGHLTKKGRIYCRKCRDSIMGKARLECAECLSFFVVRKSEESKYKCCSLECRNKQISKRQKGDKSHFWRGGLTVENMTIRNSAEAKKWRSSVFLRDNYTCVSCGVRGGKLCADHIKSFSLYPALRFVIGNGRTLCYPCHTKTDNFGYRAIIEAKELTNSMGHTQLGLI